jgi:hypothetical protein
MKRQQPGRDDLTNEEREDLDKARTSGEECVYQNLVRDYLLNENPGRVKSLPSIQYGYKLNACEEEFIDLADDRRIPNAKKNFMTTFDKEYPIDQEAVFIQLTPSPNIAAADGIKDTIRSLMGYIFEKRKQANDVDNRLTRQTILVHASGVGVDSSSSLGHTIGFAFNTDGESIIIDGLSSCETKVQKKALQGFREACESHNIEAKNALRFTPLEDPKFEQSPNGCMFMVSAMQNAIDTKQPFLEQKEQLGQKMANFCCRENAEPLREKIVNAVLSSNPNKSSTPVRGASAQSTTVRPASTHAPAQARLTPPSKPVKPNSPMGTLSPFPGRGENSAPSLEPRQAVSPFFFPSANKSPLLAKKGMTIQPLETEPKLAANLVYERLSISDDCQKYKLRLEGIKNSTSSSPIRFVTNRATGDNSFKEKDVFFYKDNKLTLTAAKPHPTDYISIFNAALTLWPEQKLVIANHSVEDEKKIKQVALAYYGRMVYEQAVADIGGLDKWDDLRKEDEKKEKDGGIEGKIKQKLLEAEQKLSKSLGSFDDWFGKQITFKSSPTNVNEDSPPASSLSISMG